MLVTNQLTSSSTCRSNTQTEYYVVKTAFQQLKKHLTGNTFSGSGFFKQIAELFF